MDGSWFDSLTKTLARPMGRRQMLKLGLAAGAGAFVAGTGAGNVSAADPCVKFCQSKFSGRDAQECMLTATLGKGLCYSPCGPHAAAGAVGTLCGSHKAGRFTSYDATTCCPANRTCTAGTCAPATNFCALTPQPCIAPEVTSPNLLNGGSVLTIDIGDSTGAIVDCIVNATADPTGPITPPYPSNLTITMTKIDSTKPAAVKLHAAAPCGKTTTWEASW